MRWLSLIFVDFVLLDVCVGAMCAAKLRLVNANETKKAAMSRQKFPFNIFPVTPPEPR